MVKVILKKKLNNGHYAQLTS